MTLNEMTSTADPTEIFSAPSASMPTDTTDEHAVPLAKTSPPAQHTSRRDELEASGLRIRTNRLKRFGLGAGRVVATVAIFAVAALSARVLQLDPLIDDALLEKGIRERGRRRDVELPNP